MVMNGKKNGLIPSDGAGRNSWPGGRARANGRRRQIPARKPIDLLRPHSDLHQKVIEYLDKRVLDMSERKMSDFTARWRSE